MSSLTGVIPHSMCVSVELTLVANLVLLYLIQAYFWQFDPDTGDCAVRQEVTVHGIRSVWTVCEVRLDGLVVGYRTAGVWHRAARHARAQRARHRRDATHGRHRAPTRPVSHSNELSMNRFRR